jgi:hypothetical protein
MRIESEGVNGTEVPGFTIRNLYQFSICLTITKQLLALHLAPERKRATFSIVNTLDFSEAKMKQIFYTAMGTWITIAAMMALTYLPGDASPHDQPRNEPIIRKLNIVLPGERGAGIDHELTGLFTASETATAESHDGVAIQKWWVECLPRDYRRSTKPLHEHVSAYLSVTNDTKSMLKALSVTLQFISRSGYILHEENTEVELKLPAGHSAERVRFWYAENNEFVANGPYDIVSALVASGSLQVRTIIRKATFDDE